MEKLESRNRQIDLLKIFATFAVVKLHCGTGGFAGEIIHYMCGYAVPAFFMISGALMLGNRKEKKVIYFLKRSYSILKLIFIWNILLEIAKCVNNRSVDNPFGFLIRSIFQEGALWHFWYLWSLLFLTIFSPVIWKIFEKKRSTWIYFIILFSVCLCFSLADVYGTGKGWIDIESYVPQSMRIWTHLLYFSLGGIIFRYFDSDLIKDYLKKQSYFAFIMMLILSVGTSVVQYSICNGILNLHSPEYCFSNPVIISFNILLFVFILNMQNYKMLESKLLSALCSDSLGIYILHPFLISIFSHLKILPDCWPGEFLLLSLSSILLTELIRRIPLVKKLVQL